VLFFYEISDFSDQIAFHF